jgi:mediator of RNA polymerase II transcription subunit 17, fungi type
MTESLSLPLRLPATKSQDHDSLQSRIFQIHSQKGAFRDVTEASLLAEIKSQKQKDEDTTMVEVEVTEVAEPENRGELIMKSREEMIQQLR